VLHPIFSILMMHVMPKRRHITKHHIPTHRVIHSHQNESHLFPPGLSSIKTRNVPLKTDELIRSKHSLNYLTKL